MIRVTDIVVDSTGKDQRFQVTVIRYPEYGGLRVLAAPVTDLPQDVRGALLSWLGAPVSEPLGGKS